MPDPVLFADNERYRITDLEFMGYTLSLTELKPGKQTRGHFHPHGSPETYIFLTTAIFVRGEARGDERETLLVAPDQFIQIRGTEFHQVRAPEGLPASFLTVFRGSRKTHQNDYGTKTPE